jgi:deoxyribodipyrimidine photolyase
MTSTSIMQDWPVVPFNVFWFRRDLRTDDNPGLNQAMKADCR